MFKSTSDNAVQRNRNGVVNSRENSAGIDETVFKAKEPDEYDKLVSEKKDIEAKLSRINASIADASTREFTAGFRHSNRQVLAKWKKDRFALIERKNVIEKVLSGIRLKKAHSALEEESKIEAIFLEIAREMLAAPVFDRLITAAIHRVKSIHDAT